METSLKIRILINMVLISILFIVLCFKENKLELILTAVAIIAVSVFFNRAKMFRKYKKYTEYKKNIMNTGYLLGALCLIIALIFLTLILLHYATHSEVVLWSTIFASTWLVFGSLLIYYSYKMKKDLSLEIKKKSKTMLYGKEMRQNMIYRLFIFVIAIIVIKAVLGTNISTIVMLSIFSAVFIAVQHYSYKFIEKNQNKDFPLTLLLGSCLIIGAVILLIFSLAFVAIGKASMASLSNSVPISIVLFVLGFILVKTDKF